MNFSNSYQLKSIIKEYENSFISENKLFDTSSKKDILISDFNCKCLYMLLRKNKQGVSKTFVYRYSFKGKLNSLSIGKYPQCDLNNAREIAKGYNNIIESVEYKQKGLNLKEYLQLLDIKDKNKHITFNRVRNEWLASKNIRAVTFASYKLYSNILCAAFGNKDIRDITKNDILALLQDYQTSSKLATCKTLYSICKRIFNYAVALDYIMYSVCDRIKYNILFKKHDVKHHETIHKQELKEILITLHKAFNNIGSAYKHYKKLDYNLIPLMYKFNIYVPLRVKNIINLEWSEVDFNNKMLIIPASKMKRGKEFKLPLNTQALAILEFMYKQKLDKYVFSLALSDAFRYKRALYNALCEYKELKDNGKCYHGVVSDLCNKYLLDRALRIYFHNIDKHIARLNETLKKGLNKTIHYIRYSTYLNTINIPNSHRLRSLFSSTLYDLTPLHKLDFTIIEMCLSHAIGNQVIQSYNHSERMQERRELMDFWGNYIDSLVHVSEIKKASNSQDLFVINPNDRLGF